MRIVDGVHVRPGNVSSMLPETFPHVRAPGTMSVSFGIVTMIDVFETLVVWRVTNAAGPELVRKFASVGSGKLLPVITTVVAWVALPVDGDAVPPVGHA